MSLARSLEKRLAARFEVQAEKKISSTMGQGVKQAGEVLGKDVLVKSEQAAVKLESGLVPAETVKGELGEALRKIREAIDEKFSAMVNALHIAPKPNAKGIHPFEGQIPHGRMGAPETMVKVTGDYNASLGMVENLYRDLPSQVTHVPEVVGSIGSIGPTKAWIPTVGPSAPIRGPRLA